MDSWFQEKKYNIGLDFPNLPYVIDGDVKLTQSLAVIRYLGRKYGLYPSEADIDKADMFELVIQVLRESFAKVCYSSETYEERKKGFLEKLPKQLEEIGSFIGEGPYVLGAKITYVECYSSKTYEERKKDFL